MHDVVDEPRHLRECVRDLMALSTSPSLWTGYSPAQIAQSLAELLLSALKNDAVAVRLIGSEGVPSTECVRMAEALPFRDEEIVSWLRERMSTSDESAPGGPINTVCVPIRCGREYGMIAAASALPGFPSDLQRLLLNVASNQAAVALHNTYLMPTVQNLFDEKQAALAREQNARSEADRAHQEARKILERITDGFAAMDCDWTVTYINKQAEQILRKAHPGTDSLVGKNLWQELPELAETVFDKECRKALATQTAVRFEGYYHPLWLETKAYPSEEGLSIYFRDITERKRTEQELPRLAAIVASSNDAVIGKTLDGIITSWNFGAETLYGYTESEVLGKHISLLTPEDRLDDVQTILQKLAGGERIDHFETVRIRKDGSPVNISLSISPIRNDAGQVIGASSIARDISERRQIEEQRKQLLASEQAARTQAEEANRAKDDFLAMVSHELRTPLSAILGWIRMIRSGKLDAPTTTRALETIERNAMVQTQLIDDLLDVSRIITGKLRLDVGAVDLIEVIESAIDSVRLAAEAKGLRLHAVLDPSAGPVSGDSNRLQQIVWNLLTNAIKFTPRGGHIHVVLERINSHVQIQISDTGQGISPDFLPYIFNPFRQAPSSRRTGGLGLGLAIVRHLVELHGGTIRASNRSHGSGATFSVELPIMLARTVTPDPNLVQATAATAALFQDPVPLNGIEVMVVDDDATSLELVSTILSRNGAEVRTAASAREAIECLTTWRPDVMVSDIDMPVEDGYALIGKIRALEGESGHQIPAVALTAHARVEDRLRAISAGFQIHVPKPVEPAELIAVVASLCRRIGQKQKNCEL